MGSTTPYGWGDPLLPPEMSLAEIEALVEEIVEDLIAEGLVHRDEDGGLHPTEKGRAHRAGPGLN